MTKRELLDQLELANDDGEITLHMFWFTTDGTRCSRVQDLTTVFVCEHSGINLIADELDEEPNEPEFPGFSTS